MNCRSRKEDYLKELARDNTQLLLNKLWEVSGRSDHSCEAGGHQALACPEAPKFTGQGLIQGGGGI